MKKIITPLLLSLLFLLSPKAYAQTYDLVWSDEFDYQGLPDASKWGYDTGANGWGNNEWQNYTAHRSENARVENGNLIIEARKDWHNNIEYSSARLITRGKGDWLYGKIEVRAKVPGGRGVWPAIWMLPTDWAYGDWPNSGEIDIMEHVGYEPNVVYGTVHTEAYNHRKGTQKMGSISRNDIEYNYHTYAVIWTPDKIDFIMDETIYHSFDRHGGSAEWPFDKRFHLILNIAVGGDWGGAHGVDPNIWPQRMEVDYVRVYSIGGNKSIVNGDFTDGMNNWSSYIDPAANANISVNNGELTTNITNGGNAEWNVQAFQGNLQVENGKSYKVTFDARSNANRTIAAKVEKNGSPYTQYGGQEINISTQTSTYSYEFTMNEPTDNNARVCFNMGLNAADVFIDNVIISEAGFNEKPVAVVGNNQTLQPGTTTTTLSGLNSYDPDNGPAPLSYQWTQINGPTVVISDTGDANPDISGLSDGNSYAFELVVNDGEKNSDARTVVIDVESNITNMLINGDFSDNLTGWSPYIYDFSASGNFEVIDEELVVTIGSGGTEQWNVQIYQGGLNIENGKTYRVSFDAHSSANRTITCLVEQNGAPYTTYGGTSNNISLSNQMTNYSYEFIMNEASDLNARLTFNLGGSSANVIIDNVVLVESSNIASIVDAGQDLYLPSGTSCTVLDGTATDPDNQPNPLTFSWAQVAGHTVTISEPNVLRPEICGLTDGSSYTFLLTVFDGESTSTDEVNIEVGTSYVELVTSTTGTGSGRIEPASGHFAIGETIIVTAIPDPGSYFVGWLEIDDPVIQATIDIVMYADIHITAIFDKLPSTFIEAETYSATGSVNGGEGVLTETCNDENGGLNIGWVDAGDWTTYDSVNLAPGTYSVEIRYAGYGGQVQFEQAGGAPVYGVVDIPARPEPNAWQNWASVTATITITEQTTNLGVYFPDGDININWYKFTPVSVAKSTREDKLALAIDNETFANFELKAYPNPVSTELKVSGLENVNNLTIFNLRGQRLIMKELDGSNETTINVEKLQKGIFLIKASKAGEIRTLKFIKK